MTDAAAVTVDELCRAFLAQHRASPARMELLAHMLRLAMRAFDRRPVDELDPQELAAWQASLRPATRWQATQALKQVTAWAARWQLIDRDPLLGLANARVRAREMEPFHGWGELVALADQLPDRLRLLPVIGAGCGLRPGELLGLDWSSIDLQRRTLTVRSSVWRGELRAELKTRGSRRLVPLRARVVAELAANQRASGLVFRTPAGDLLDLHNLRRRDWYPAQRAAGTDPPRRIYDLRHTYATWSLRAGVSIFQLARRMGTSTAMIDATYGHLAADASDYERQLLDAWDDLR